MEARRSRPFDGLTLRQAALVAGFGYLLSPVSYAEFTLYPRLVIPGHIERTAQNIGAHSGTFAAIILCYLITFAEDIVVAWALYILLAPVNRGLSLLTAWFRLVYAGMALFATLNLVTVFRLFSTPEYPKLFGTGPLYAQADLLLHTFRYEWSMSLVIFAVHLLLLGYLIFRSGYIPKIIGILLAIDGLGWIVTGLQPYLYPNLNVDILFVTFFGELIFMLWLLVFGWRLKEPSPAT